MPKPRNREQPASRAKRNGHLKRTGQARRAASGRARPERPQCGGARWLQPVRPSTPSRHREILLAGSGGSRRDFDREDAGPGRPRRGFQRHVHPRYAAEVRGGTAHCHVKMGHRPIGSPIVEDATMSWR